MSDELWRLWLKKAKSNLARAKLGRQTPDILYEDLCFDAQQAAEKALKGIMAFFKIDIPKTHSIGYLLKLIEESGVGQVTESLKEAAILTDYAVTTRYPGDWEPIDEAEYKQAVSLAQEVYQWALSLTKQHEEK
ncbi:HEPN domain protein [Neomoorella glycerini]|uniref:HEPN domain protein n=1 Tax=Neomoorella glycerini TaxID=55779 RepID=A0A6I5ZP11_9FIRM|nr:HEPN domain-containing protein [Moorella glycerini]QGP91660.1 HEPN domain protein [Moorella glycerini]